MKTLLLASAALLLSYTFDSQAQQGPDSQMQTNTTQGQDLSREQGNGTTIRDDRQSQDEKLPRRTSDEGSDLNDDEDQYEDSDEDQDSDY